MLKKIAFGGVGILLLATPFISSADTLSDLQAQVQVLIAQLQALQAQAGLSTSPIVDPVGPTDDYGTGVQPSSACPKLSITMQRGARDITSGGQVSELQIFLADYYNLNEEDIVTGYFGKVTEANVIKFQNQYGLPAYGIAGSLTRAKIAQVCGGSTTPPTGSITVTAPNGGEQWEIGQLNTITWAPYGYNPNINASQDVTVYLEQIAYKDNGEQAFASVGKVMDTGKASLHTYFNIENYDKWATPGQYYVRAVNTVTGAWDRSDAPFTLLPRSVDLKVNGSDGPVSVSDNEAITVSWGIGFPWITMEGGCTLSGVRTTPGGSTNPINLGTNSGSATYYAYAPVAGAYTSLQLSCVDGAKGLTHTDYASVVSKGGTAINASVKVLSPNGGEKLRINQPYTILFNYSGLKSYSIALYKNDQWMKWLLKDAPVGKEGYTWMPTSAELGAVNELGNVFKIYITGQKADGTGYVDDKSDAPFSFTGGDTGPQGTLVTYRNGLPVGSGTGITEAAALANCKLNAALNPLYLHHCVWNNKIIYSDTSVTLAYPNGGESFVAGSGNSVTIRWTAQGVPGGSTVCTVFRPEGLAGGGFAFPGSGSCSVASSGTGAHTGTLIQNAGYDLAPGTYRAYVTITGQSDGGKDGVLLAEDKSDATFTLTGNNYDSSTKLLLHADGADAATTFTDSSASAKTVTANGNAQIDTAQSKFGGASALLAGDGNYLSVADSADWDFPGDYTVDFWARVAGWSGVGNYASLIDIGGFSLGIDIYLTTSGAALNFYSGDGAQNIRTVSVALDTWHHYAISRSGSDVRMFLDGVQLGATVTNSASINTSSGVRIGSDILDGAVDFNGWSDEVRVSKGIARWTSNFTPPTSVYSASASAGAQSNTNANLANALTALQAVLLKIQKLLGGQ